MELISGHSIVPVSRPLLPAQPALEPYLKRLDDARTYSNHGPLVLELEQRLSALFRLPDRHAVTCSSGSLALIGAILALRDRVPPARNVCLMPAFSFVATAAAAGICGFRTRLVDIDPDSWALDPEALRDHPRLGDTGLVIPVAPFGRAINLAAWQRFADDTGIPVLVDAAAGFEWLIQSDTELPPDVPVVISLHATKSFSSAEGGLILTRNEQFGRNCIRAVNHGFLGSREALLPGVNGKMSEYHAAVALAELDGWSEKARCLDATSRSYRKVWGEVSPAGRLWTAPDIAGCYALFEAPTRSDAARAAARLSHNRIDSRFWYGRGLQEHRAFRNLERDDLSTTMDIADRQLGLPCFPDLETADITRIVRALV